MKLYTVLDAHNYVLLRTHDRAEAEALANPSGSVPDPRGRFLGGHKLDVGDWHGPPLKDAYDRERAALCHPRRGDP